MAYSSTDSLLKSLPGEKLEIPEFLQQISKNRKPVTLDGDSEPDDSICGMSASWLFEITDNFVSGNRSLASAIDKEYLSANETCKLTVEMLRGVISKCFAIGADVQLSRRDGGLYNKKYRPSYSEITKHAPETVIATGPHIRLYEHFKINSDHFKNTHLFMYEGGFNVYTSLEYLKDIYGHELFKQYGSEIKQLFPVIKYDHQGKRIICRGDLTEDNLTELAVRREFERYLNSYKKVHLIAARDIVGDDSPYATFQTLTYPCTVKALKELVETQDRYKAQLPKQAVHSTENNIIRITHQINSHLQNRWVETFRVAVGLHKHPEMTLYEENIIAANQSLLSQRFERMQLMFRAYHAAFKQDIQLQKMQAINGEGFGKINVQECFKLFSKYHPRVIEDLIIKLKTQHKSREATYSALSFEKLANFLAIEDVDDIQKHRDQVDILKFIFADHHNPAQPSLPHPLPAEPDVSMKMARLFSISGLTKQFGLVADVFTVLAATGIYNGVLATTTQSVDITKNVVWKTKIDPDAGVISAPFLVYKPSASIHGYQRYLPPSDQKIVGETAQRTDQVLALILKQLQQKIQSATGSSPAQQQPYSPFWSSARHSKFDTPTSEPTARFRKR